MKLDILERIVISGLLPEKGSFINLGLLRKAKEDLSFTEEEHKKFNFRSIGDGRIEWDQTEDPVKDIQIGDVVSGMISNALKDLDAKEAIEERHISLYRKFVLKEDN